MCWLGSRVVSVLDSGTEGPRVQIAVTTLSGNSLRQTVHTHCASVHQAAELVAALLRVAGFTFFYSVSVSEVSKAVRSVRFNTFLAYDSNWLKCSSSEATFMGVVRFHSTPTHWTENCSFRCRYMYISCTDVVWTPRLVVFQLWHAYPLSAFA